MIIKNILDRHETNLYSQLIYFLATIKLDRIAGESLASSVPESVSERCEQCALGLQKIAWNRELVSKPKIEL
jgi:hypothetical protein